MPRGTTLFHFPGMGIHGGPLDNAENNEVFAEHLKKQRQSLREKCFFDYSTPELASVARDYSAAGRGNCDGVPGCVCCLSLLKVTRRTTNSRSAQRVRSEQTRRRPPGWPDDATRPVAHSLSSRSPLRVDPPHTLLDSPAPCRARRHLACVWRRRDPERTDEPRSRRRDLRYTRATRSASTRSTTRAASRSGAKCSRRRSSRARASTRCSRRRTRSARPRARRRRRRRASSRV